MTLIQSKINAVKSRIAQIETSDLFTPEDRTTLLKVNQTELQTLINQIQVNQPVTTTN